MDKKDIAQALVRGYCTKRNSKKVVDTDLINDMTDEVIKLANREKPGYCEIGMSSCRCGWRGEYPVSGCPSCNRSFVE
jgi:hypothetical protein